MILCLDTLGERTEVTLIAKGVVLGRKKGTTKKKKVDLLDCIDVVLDAQNISLKNVEAIAVLTGPGSFSAVRQSVVTANALGYVLDIPVCAVAQEVQQRTHWPQAVEDRCAKKKGYHSIDALYAQEPNITMPK